MTVWAALVIRADMAAAPMAIRKLDQPGTMNTPPTAMAVRMKLNPVQFTSPV